MTTKQQTSLSVAFSDDITECRGVLFELPTAEVMAGDTIELRLWGGTHDLLLPYTLYRGTQTMGAGTLVEETGVPQIAPVIDFARFENEAKLIKSFGGSLLRITRGSTIINNHESETEQDEIECDFTIGNYGTIQELKNTFKLNYIV